MIRINKILLIILAMVFYISIASPQTPDTVWTRTYGSSDFEISSSVINTTDDNYMVTGCHYTDELSYGFLLKINQYGDTIWYKEYECLGPGYTESLTETEDGGFLVIGLKYYPETENKDVLLFKTNDLGDTVWSKSYGGSQLNTPISIIPANDSGYIVIGETGNLADDMDIWLLRINDLGDTVWTKTFGGDGVDLCYDIKSIADNGYILVGQIDTYSSNAKDVYLIKFDNSCDTVWTKTYGSEGDESGMSIICLDDQGFLITGCTNSDPGGLDDLYIIRVNGDGDSLYSKIYGGDEGEGASSILPINNNTFLISGVTSSYGLGGYDLYFLVINDNGDTISTATFGGAGWDYAYDAIKANNQSFITCGFSSSFGAGDYDVYLANISIDNIGIIHETHLSSSLYYALNQNYPNPFNAATTITFNIITTEFVTLKLYDILGREIRTLHNEISPPGMHEILLNAAELTSGVYFYRLQAGGYSESQKLVLMK